MLDKLKKILGMGPKKPPQKPMLQLSVNRDDDKRSRTRRIMDDRRERGLSTDREVRRCIRRRLRSGVR